MDMDCVGYGYESNAKVRIFKSNTDLFDKKRSVHESEVELIDYDGISIPLILRDVGSLVIDKHDDHVRLGFDLYAAAFYLLSGFQEYVSESKDHYGRFQYKDSFQYKYDCVMLPVVNYYFELLMDSIDQADLSRPVLKTSADAAFTFYLSHDIDQCRSGWKIAVKHVMSRLNLNKALRIIVERISGKDPWWSFDRITSGERKYGVYSTYYFLTSRLRKGNILHADYDIDSPKIKSLIEHLESQGDQVCLHGSFGTAQSLEALKEDFNLLSRDGIRFHFLGWSQKSTPQILDKLEFTHDSTLGFAEHIGFRNSICHPFPLYDIYNEKILEVIEYPLNIMDTTFYNDNYMGVDSSDVTKHIEPVLTQIEKFNGHLSILWHNNYFSDYKYAGWGKVYWDIIKILKERKGVCSLPKVNIV